MGQLGLGNQTPIIPSPTRVSCPHGMCATKSIVTSLSLSYTCDGRFSKWPSPSELGKNNCLIPSWERAVSQLILKANSRILECTTGSMIIYVVKLGLLVSKGLADYMSILVFLLIMTTTKI